VTARPFASVIVLNYNGAHYLPACLDALRAQAYPAESFEVIVADNGSTDGSQELLQKEYPWVRLLENGENLGFASGNNAAIRVAKGQYIALLNNDTAPRPDWLKELVETAEKHPRAGLVTARLQLFYDQVILELSADAFVPPNDGRELGVQVFEVDSNAPRGIVQYLEGFHGRETASAGQEFRWTSATAALGVPVPQGSEGWPLSLRLAASRPDNRPVRVRASLQGDPLAEWSVTGSGPAAYRLEMPASARAQATPLVQNTGAIIFRDGAGRDRGTYVRDFQVYYEADEGQYDQPEEVFSGCGASLLLRREMLEDVGLFDDDLFMYYEDTDLSWRARLRGWKVLYAPSAIVRHIHCGTTVEWSPLFLYLIERNRLAMVFKNGSWSQVTWAWGKYLARVGINTWKATLAFIRRQDNWREAARWPRQHARVLGTLLKWMPALLRKRRKIQASRQVPHADLRAWFVE
jgi:GT2 family glycosyltransferase